MQLKVVSLPGKNLIKTNTIYHGDINNKNEYIEIKETLYPTQYTSNIDKDCIALNLILRQKYQLALNDFIHVEFTTYIPSFPNYFDVIDSLEITISKQKKTNIDIILDDSKIKKYLVSTLKNILISYNQYFIVEIEGINYIINIVTKGKMIGIISETTNISQYTDDNIKFSTSRLIPKSIFSPDFSFTSVGIGGMSSELDSILKEALALRAIDPKIVQELGAKYVKGMILYGPPGTGKTLIARQLGKLLTIKEPKIINGPELFNKYVGQSEENIRNVFQDAIDEYKQKGDYSDLHIIIFDEIDAICRTRGSSEMGRVGDSVLTQLLTMLDGTNIQLPNIFVIGMTNRIDLLDPALIRPGRLEIHMKIDLPNLEGRREIFNIYINKIHEKYIPNKINLQQLCEMTENFSGAEIEAVVKKACSIAANHSLVNNQEILITQSYFLESIQTIKPSFGKNISLDYHQENEKIHSVLTTLTSTSPSLFSCIIQGYRYTNKTDSLLYLAKHANITFTKMIRPIDVVQMDDITRSNYIINIVKDGYLSEKSLILIDDIDIIMNFSDIMGIVNFSNKLLQTVLTIIKTNKSNFFVIATLSSERLFSSIKEYFTQSIIF